MTEHEQIKEMQKTLLEGLKPLKETYGTDEIVRILYDADYRKQSKGEWKILKMGDGEKVRTCSACLISQTVNVYKGKVMFRYCPYCGADMRKEGER